MSQKSGLTYAETGVDTDADPNPLRARSPR